MLRVLNLSLQFESDTRHLYLEVTHLSSEEESRASSFTFPMGSTSLLKVQEVVNNQLTTFFTQTTRQQIKEKRNA